MTRIGGILTWGAMGILLTGFAAALVALFVVPQLLAWNGPWWGYPLGAFISLFILSFGFVVVFGDEL